MCNAVDAEDVCQQAYLKAIQAQAQIVEPDRLGGWLTRVVINESLMHCRKQSRETEFRKELATNVMSVAGDGEPILLERLADRDWVLHALDRLDESMREVVVLRVMQEMSGQETSRLLGCSATLVSRRLHRGLDRLRQFAEISDRNEVAK